MNIYESITAIMQESYAIGKNKRNQKQGFNYRGIDDVMNTLQPLLSAYKVFCVPEVLDAQREERQANSGGNLIYSVLKIRYTFYAEDGSSVSAVVVGEGMDSGDKASNKAMAVGMKYAMFQTFCIPTEEMALDDPDRTTPEPSKPVEKSKEQPAPPKAKEPPKKRAIETDILCEKCGQPLKPYYNANGKEITVQRHAEKSKELFGKVLCLDCIKAAKDEDRAG